MKKVKINKVKRKGRKATVNKDKALIVRVDASEHRAVIEASTDNGLTISGYLRKLIFKKVKS